LRNQVSPDTGGLIVADEQRRDEEVAKRPKMDDALRARLVDRLIEALGSEAVIQALGPERALQAALSLTSPEQTENLLQAARQKLTAANRDDDSHSP